MYQGCKLDKTARPNRSQGKYQKGGGVVTTAPKKIFAEAWANRVVYSVAPLLFTKNNIEARGWEIGNYHQSFPM